MTNLAYARDVLQWHIDVGVDETIGETPVNRFQVADAPVSPPVGAPINAGNTRPNAQPNTQLADAPNVAHHPSSPPPGPVPTHTTPTRPTDAPPGPSGEQAVRSAYELAEQATSVDALREALEGFDGCSLKKTATSLVFCNGDPKARLMLVGEAPGAQEDREGEPFVGPSGALLNKMLASIDIQRADVLVSNTVFWRPPGNRTPTLQETAVCMPFVERLIELVDPDVLVAFGGPAAKALLGETRSVGRLRGHWFTYETARMSHPVDATAMFHPAYLLRTPSQKRATWQDLLSIRDKLSG